MNASTFGSARVPALLFAALYAAFLMALVFSLGLLPERVATHFNGAGNPDGWMSRPALLAGAAAFGLVFPLFVVAICSLLRFLPARFVNLPNRDYWLEPERRSATNAAVATHAWWLACLEIVFVGGMHFLLVQANRVQPPHVSNGGIAAVAGIFLIGVAFWIVALYRRFRTMPGPDA